MERTVYQKLLAWKDASDRKPLILLGARQVGKTYILKELGRREFQNMVYVNCHNNAFADTLFRDFDTERIVHAIEVNYEVKIERRCRSRLQGAQGFCSQVPIEVLQG